MSWNDWDYLMDGLEKTQESLRRRLEEIRSLSRWEEWSEEDTDKAIDGVDLIVEQIFNAMDSKISDIERFKRTEALVASIKEVPDAVLPWTTRNVLSLDLEHAISQEKQNQDPSEPFTP